MAKRINLLTKATKLNDDDVIAVDSSDSAGQTRSIAINDFKQYIGIGIVKQYFSTDGSSWYRIWADGWCEQGGYTCDANMKFNKNVSYYSTYQCKISLLVPFANSNYFAFVSAESHFNNGKGNCGYDYIVTGSKTASDFRAIMCSFNANGSANSHYSRQYWEAKGMVDMSTLQDLLKQDV